MSAGIRTLTLALLVALAGCGDEEEPRTPPAPGPRSDAEAPATAPRLTLARTASGWRCEVAVESGPDAAVTGIALYDSGDRLLGRTEGRGPLLVDLEALDGASLRAVVTLASGRTVEATTLL